MSALSTKLNASFLDYESLGNKQTISLVVELAGEIDVELLKRHLVELPKQFKGIDFVPPLRLAKKPPILSDVSEIFSNGQTAPLEFHLVGEKDKFYFVGLYHHSFCDGLGGLEVFRRIIEPRGEENLEREKEALKEFEKQEKESYSLRKGLKIGAKYIRARSETKLTEKTESDWQRKVTVVSRPINEVRQLKNKLGCSPNELYLFGISQILNKFYPDGRKSSALVPVNLRPRGLRTTLGNFILVVPVELPKNDQFNLNLLKKISNDLMSPEILNSYRSARAFVLKLPQFLRLPTLLKLARATTCIATYVPDGVSKRELCGAKIVSEFGMPALLPGHEIGFCLITTKDEFSVGITTAGRFLDRGEEAKDAFERVFRL